jgi:hypothetical protein
MLRHAHFYEGGNRTLAAGASQECFIVRADIQTGADPGLSRSLIAHRETVQAVLKSKTARYAPLPWGRWDTCSWSEK